MFAEVRVRSGTNWANYSIVHRVQNLTFDNKWQDVGAISFDVTQDDLNTYGLGDQAVVEIAPNGTSFDNMWYAIDGTSGTKVADGVTLRTLSGNGIINWLTDGVVYPSTWPLVPTVNPDGTTATVIQGHSFQDATPGNIIRTLVARCVERGTLLWIDVSNFTGTTTTDGVGWGSTLSTTYANGTTLLQVIQDLAARNLIEFKMTGMQLSVYNYGTQATHYTPEQVTFIRGKNVIEQNTNTDSSASASTVLIQGDDAAIVEVNDSGLEAAIGRRREKYVSQGGITDIPTLTLLGNAELSISGHIQNEETLGVTDNDIQPWVNYKIGDWVWENVDGTFQNIQIQQIAGGGQDNNDLTIGLTLGDILTDADEKLQQKINNITGAGSGSYGALPNTIPNFLAPSPPTGVVASPTAYRDVNGNDLCQMTITWSIPVTNIDGSPLTDLDHYDVQYQIDGGNWSVITTVAANATIIAAFYSNLPCGHAFNSQVRAVDTNGNASTWAAQTDSIPAMPHVTTTPPTPSTPVLTSALQSVRVTWDGFDNTGTAYDSAWSYTLVFIGTTSGFTPSSANQVGGFTTKGGTISVGGLSYGTTYYAKLIVVDKSNNTSNPSLPSNGVAPAQLTDPDLPANLISGAKIADGTITTNQLTVSAFLDSVAGNGSFEDVTNNPTADTTGAAGWKKVNEPTNTVPANNTIVLDTTPADAASGNNCLHLHVKGGSGFPYGVFFGLTTPVPTAFPDIWYVTFRAKSSQALANGITATMSLGDTPAEAATLTHTANGQNVTAIAGDSMTTWTDYEVQFQVPTGSVNYAYVNFIIGASTFTGGIFYPSDTEVYFDSISVRPVGGNASIADASINSAKITDVTADLITAGTLNADIITGARIKTSDTGARVELNSNGLQAYDDDENLTLNASAVDGSIVMTGQLQGGGFDFPSTDVDASFRLHADASGMTAVGAGIINLVNDPSLESPPTVTPKDSHTTTAFTGASVGTAALFGTSALRITSTDGTDTMGYVDIPLGPADPNTVYTVSFYLHSRQS